MKIKLNAEAAESITISVLKKHIKIQDELAHEAYHVGFSACGDDYNNAIHMRSCLEEVLEYFDGITE